MPCSVYVRVAVLPVLSVRSLLARQVGGKWKQDGACNQTHALGGEPSRAEGAL